ncbi:hypothetical protein ART_0415 [Arthrobacter sp. PAMC 25486]|uniref:TetR/AcrR family transcriptional regulator n=1 Tax=Arthrobacter sp. PAMC 25486 TaxID=1494608 RepID=UPI0005361EFA|nr:TetR/AcrR family transcriptional regulator [Arthrobacter sp. PAMC 25486]AIY00014.1 hypothetical protein ART_0415 [Arthrobacter sp. PAMC 25486]
MTADSPAHSQAGSGLWHGTARNARDEQRRRRLLEAALELHGTLGYGSTTVQTVCKLAKVSTRSFYELYADHEELLTRLYLELNDEVLATINGGGIEHAPDLFTAVRSLVSAALGPMLADERKARVMEIEAVGVSAALEQQRRATIRRLAVAVDTAFDAFADAGLVESAPKGLSSLILIGGITEALVQRVLTEPSHREPTREFIDEVARVIVLMTGPAPDTP